MKKIFSIAVLMVFFLGMNATANAQEKFGHINTNELLQMMPGREEASQQLEKFAQELETQFTTMQREFQTKYQDYLENQENLSQLIRQSRERELSSLQERITEFQESAQDELVQEENRLLQPIVDQARNAIEEVAKENGYTYVFDRSVGVLLYSDPGDDIMPLVKAKLGLE
ncbi:MAG: OmpH family outer membrane protein [Bacteroidales bacterium]